MAQEFNVVNDQHSLLLHFTHFKIAFIVIDIRMQNIMREKTSLSEKEKEYETLKNIQENVEEQLKELKNEEEIILEMIKEEENKLQRAAMSQEHP